VIRARTRAALNVKRNRGERLGDVPIVCIDHRRKHKSQR